LRIAVHTGKESGIGLLVFGGGLGLDQFGDDILETVLVFFAF
jgi:hypothetical protein